MIMYDRLQRVGPVVICVNSIYLQTPLLYTNPRNKLLMDQVTHCQLRR